MFIFPCVYSSFIAICFVATRAASESNLLRVLHYYYDTGRIDLIRTETAQPAISLKNLRAKFPLPAIPEQDAILACLDAYDTRLRAEEAYRDKLKLLKAGLMDDLLTGQVRVKT